MIRGWQVTLMLGIVGLLLLFYQGLWGDPRYIPPVLVGKSAPVFSGPDLITGEPRSLDRFQGKVILINFWASWCRECMLEHENLLAISRRYAENPDFVMLGVNYQDNREDALAYLERHGNNFRHVRDIKGAISIDYGVYGVPETFVIDQEGRIRFKHVGPIIGEVYTHLIRNVLDPLLEGRMAEAL